jgi:hypothetical protein
MKIIKSFFILNIVFLGVCAAFSQSSLDENTKALFEGNEKELIDYLKTHQVPLQLQESTFASFNNPVSLPQVERVIELFKNGSDKVRAAIPPALVWASEEQIDRLWELCKDEDALSKHYFVGIALNTTDDHKKKFRKWMLEQGDVKYAAALLKNLNESVFIGADESEIDDIYAFIKELYKQPGIIRIHENPKFNESVQKCVVKLLPSTERSFDILLEWMVADSKTADEETLVAMWGQWQRFKLSTKKLKGKEFFEKAAQMPEVAESWLRSPYRTSISEVRISMEASSLFSKNITSQIFNKDDTIREKAIECRLSRGTGYENLTYLKNLNVTASQRQQALADTQKVYEKLKKTEIYQDKAFASRLEDNYKKLADALAQ